MKKKQEPPFAEVTVHGETRKARVLAKKAMEVMGTGRENSKGRKTLSHCR